ncbi:hypothetical protein [Oscillatoria sp. HE19RPO]|uniref:hypothetical protein n=1 Tax=Oscillatoria sp. HE19RPO TaxID=2954806 RepID=UPI0020C2F433|nr:hypothetical protein [Oscillatoria sp. HE19RPO]
MRLVLCQTGVYHSRTGSGDRPYTRYFKSIERFRPLNRLPWFKFDPGRPLSGSSRVAEAPPGSGQPPQP